MAPSKPEHDAADEGPEGQLQGHPRAEQQLVAEPLEVDHRRDLSSADTGAQ